MLISQVILILTLIANIFIALTLIKAGLKRPLALILFVYLVGVMGWTLFILLNISMPGLTGHWVYLPGSLGYAFENLLFASSVVFIASIYWFAVYFVKNKIELSALNFFVLVFQVIVFAACFVNGAFYSKITIIPSGYASLDIKPLSLLFSVFVFSQMAAPIFILGFGRPREKDDHKRRQLLIIFAAYLIFFFVCLNTNWILPVYFHIFVLNSFGPTFSLIVVGGIAYAVSRYKFLDIRSSIQLSAGYGVLSVLFIGFYVGLLFLFGFLPYRSSVLKIPLMVGLAVTLIGIFSAPYLQKIFRKTTDHWFYKNPYNYAEALASLSKALNNNLNLEDLINEITQNIKNIFRVKEVSIIINGKMAAFRDGHYKELRYPELSNYLLKAVNEKEPVVFFSELKQDILEQVGSLRQKQNLESLDALINEFGFEVFVMLAMPEKLTGFLGLGPKLSGDRYTRQDFQFLRTFAHQAAVAIEKAILYERLKQHADDLEQKVEERTAELGNLQKSQNQVMVDISHSLQTPLTIMKSRLDSLRQEAPANEEFKSLEKTVDEISKRTYDLLRLARLESHEEQFSFEPVDLSALINEVGEYVLVLCAEQGVAFVCNIQPGIVIRGDRRKLEEMVNNLLSNALKYISNGMEITLSLKCTNHTAEVLVQDSGMGISSQDLPHIFERFYRAPGSSASGMGIGLAIAKKICESHGGSISVESILGKGSVFSVLIPLSGQKVV